MTDTQKEEHAFQRCYYCTSEIIQIMDLPWSHEWISLTGHAVCGKSPNGKHCPPFGVPE